MSVAERKARVARWQSTVEEKLGQTIPSRPTSPPPAQRIQTVRRAPAPERLAKIDPGIAQSLVGKTLEQAYEQGFLDAFRQMAEPLTQVPSYKPIAERLPAAAAKTVSAPIPLAKPRLTTKEMWNALYYWLDLLSDSCKKPLSSVAQSVAADMNEKFTLAQRAGKLVRSSQPFPTPPMNLAEFRARLSDIPDADLETYLATYGVVPWTGEPSDAPQPPTKAGSLSEQLQRLQSVGSIDAFESYDTNTRVPKPPNLV